MKYRDDLKSGKSLSILGLGCMRFPRNAALQIDMAKSEKLVLDAIAAGVNYFDTAYIYLGSEQALGTILHKNNIRDKVYIATKLPFGKCKAYEDFDKLFAEQLDHLKTDYIDYYLIHNLSDMKGWQRLCGIGIEKWIAEKKRDGKIKQIGFSFHGSQAEFSELIDAYDWEFVQIQYNYVNINYQAGEAGLKRAASKGLPVIIMEPLLGGKLASGLPKKAVELFKSANKDIAPVAWALNWLWNQPEVTVVLSGMGSDKQLAQNLETANTAKVDMLSKSELKIFDSVLEAFNESYKVPCTGCNYCMPCPHNVNIPGCFAAYNMSYATGMFSGTQQYMTTTGIFDPTKNFGASSCKKCGKCEKHCPQHISIMKSLDDVKKRMEPFWIRWLISLFVKARP